LASLREAAAEGGLPLLQQSLENVLGVHLAEAASFDPDDVAALLGAVGGSVAVQVDEQVEERSADGRVTVVVPAGPFTISSANAVTFLSSVGEGSALDRIVRHQLFWSALLDVPELVGATTLLSADALGGVEGTVQQRVLPVEAVAGVEGEDELYRVVDQDMATMIERLFPTAPRVGDRVRVRILNGAGAPGVAQRVQPLLLDAGGQMTLSGNADRFDYEVTQIVYYEDERLDDARTIQEALGVGEVVKSLAELGVVDVTVVVGADFLAAHAASGG
jgi:hypothetical protein